MTLGNLASFVGGKIGMTDSATLTKIKAWAAERYASLYAGALWKDALSIYTFAVAEDQHTVILPAHVAQFVAAKYDDERLIPVDQAFLFASYPELWDNSGTPTHCSELEAMATKVLPTAGQSLQVVNGGADTVTVSVHGEDSDGNPVSERVTMTAGATQPLNNTYRIVHGFSKASGNAGAIILSEVVSGTILQQLVPADTQRLHRRIRLHTVPSTALTVLVLGKRHPGPFTNDTDATALPPLCDQALQAYVHGDALEWMRQYGKAQTKFAEAIALEEKARKTEIYQSAQSIRFTPADGIAEGCNPGDFL